MLLKVKYKIQKELKMDGLTYKYYKKSGAKRIYIILHGGGSAGVETEFISSIFNSISLTKNSVICFNFPYCERGEEESSGTRLREEILALDQVIQYIRSEGYSEIKIIAKSLGGIIASYYFEHFPDNSIKIAILGYIPRDVKQKAIKNNLELIIQGENDRFASPLEIKKLVGDQIDVDEIKNADHSYRNDAKEPIYQNVAIERLLKWIKK